MFDDLATWLAQLWEGLGHWYATLGFNNRVILQLAFLMGTTIVLLFPARRMIRWIKKKREKSPW